MKNKAGQLKTNERHPSIRFQLLKCILKRCHVLETKSNCSFQGGPQRCPPAPCRQWQVEVQGCLKEWERKLLEVCNRKKCWCLDGTLWHRVSYSACCYLRRSKLQAKLLFLLLFHLLLHLGTDTGTIFYNIADILKLIRRDMTVLCWRFWRVKTYVKKKTNQTKNPKPSNSNMCRNHKHIIFAKQELT